MVRLPIKKLDPFAGIPHYMTPESAAMDLHADAAYLIPPGEWMAVGTNIAMAIPAGYEGQIRPRSGLAWKFGVTVLNAPGTVDSDYRGEIKVILINHGRHAFEINQDDRIAQLVIAPVVKADIGVVTELPGSHRGEGGFGSTG